MKRNLFFTLLAVVLCVGAKAGDVIVLDSTYTEYAGWGNKERTYYTYNAQGKRLTMTTYSSFYGEESINMSVNLYDEKGNLVKLEYYEIENGNKQLEGYEEYKEYKGEIPTEVITYDYDDDEGKIVPSSKVVILEFSGKAVLKAIVYEYEDGNWEEEGIMEGELNSFGAQASSTMKMDGVSIKTTFTYDDKQNETSETTTYLQGSTVLQELTVSYTYQYNSYGLPAIVKEFQDGELYRTEQHWYGPLKPNTGIGRVLADRGKTTIFNLKGQKMGTSLNELPKGIYIVKDKMGVRKVLKK